MQPLNDITLLIAEDERPVRMLLRVVLEAAGARVIAAEDGLRALRLLALHPEVDVVCTDLNMPNMSGDELARAIRAQSPGLPIVVCSASDLTSSAPGLTGIVDGVVRKPFVPGDLVQAIRTAVDEPGSRSELRRAV